MPFDPSSRAAHDPLRVVIAGGGVAALEALVALRQMAPGRVAPVVVTDATDFSYRALLVGEPFGLGAPRHYPLATLCADLGAELISDRVAEVLPEQHVVRTGAGLIAYDVLLLCPGARLYPAFQDGLTFDRELSPEDFDDALADLDEGLAPHIAVVVPDEVSWTLPAYEVALLTAAWGERRHPGESCVTVITHEREPLEVFGPAVTEGVRQVLSEARVALRCGVHPDVVTATSLRAGGAWIGADRIVSLPLLGGPRLPGLPCDAHGFIPVDDHGRVRDVDDVYAAGDAAVSAIKQGGLAAQQAAIAVADIARRAGAEDLEELPAAVLRAVLLTRHGPRFLRAELGDVAGTSTFSAEPLWWPPTKVSSRWLGPYLARLDVERTTPA
jgi:sulfide:quinone oxidoreductase